MPSSAERTRILFLSCNNQRKGPQSAVWSLIGAQSPYDAVLWTGDVVYPKSGSHLQALRTAYEELEEDGSYRAFLKKQPNLRVVAGTWDDHDLGHNDGSGHDVRDDIVARQALFLDFLHVSDPKRRAQKGLYHVDRSVDNVALITLDTRTFRSTHVIPSVGAVGSSLGPLGKPIPLFAAVTRVLSAYTGLTLFNDEKRTVLGEDQWAWLEQTLATSDARVHIIASSIQVLTTNPSVESWGHFPHERLKLLKLLHKYNPAGLLIVSGDVHVGEALATQSSREVVELTSSGLTHSCTDSIPSQFLCDLIWNYASSTANRKGLYVSRNFGEIEIDWEHQSMRSSVFGLDSAGRKLSFERSLAVSARELLGDELDRIEGVVPSDPMIRVGFISLMMICIIIGLSVLRFVMVRFVRSKRAGRTKSD